MSFKFNALAAILALALSATLATSAAELRVPAFTAYLEPNANGARISAEAGLTGWKDAALRVLWFGEFKQAGPLDASLVLRLPVSTSSKLRLTIAGQSHEATVTGAGTNELTVSFGRFELREAGYQRIALESLNEPGKSAGDLTALILAGSAAENAHFNLKSRRNAASVHLKYPQPAGVNVAAFYCELTGLEDPVTTYYMACGWHRGYFGMQVNSPTERRIIFSVWDSGGEALDRKKVDDKDRVTLVARGEGVYTGDFGNEGTGGHSHLKFPWKTGEPQRFVVTAQPTNGTFTVYSGYWLRPDTKQWMLISSWRAPKEGGWLHGLYSCSENFGGSNGHLRRKALYSNQWLRADDGRWIELTNASFSYDATGKADRLDRFMGIENGMFFLSHGGFIPGSTKYSEPFSRPAVGKPPVIEWP
jgi:hypothetical protein